MKIIGKSVAWPRAFKIIENASGPLRIGGTMKPTQFGEALLSDSGWDPFLEDPASLWLLHWKLFADPILATAWPLAMNSRLERSVPEIAGVVFTESFGNRQLQFGENPGNLAGDVLNAYYTDEDNRHATGNNNHCAG